MSQTNFPIIITSAGLQPTSPSDIRAALVASAVAMAPGLTTELPGSLVEDIVSTDVAAIALSNQAMVELVNSLTPYGANNFLLNQLGQIYGVPLGQGSNTSVFVVFTGNPGYTIAAGFVVGDGTYQYIVQDGGIIGSGGTSAQLYCLSTTAGTFSVGANTVTQILTSVPTGVPLSCTNPNPGTPGTGPQTAEGYRAQVLQAGQAVSQGMITTLRTALGNVLGVQTRLISIQQDSPGYKILVGGGDPYKVANAIFLALFDINDLQGSSVNPDRNEVVNITDYPDIYVITYVNPVSQNVGINVTWNTISTNIVSPTAVAQAAIPALVNYINSIYVGQPINLFELQATFQNAVINIIPTPLLTRMIFTVTINSVVVNPEVGTGIIAGDAEGYFITTSSAITVVQG